MNSLDLRRGVRGLLVCAIAITVAACGGGGGSGGGKQPTGNPSPPGNNPPTAAAGPDLTVFKHSTVMLDGSGSSDPDGHALTYSWVQQSGASVELTSATSVKPTFKAPGTTDTLVFRLVVNDGRVDSVADEVSVAIQNRVPTADAGKDVAAAIGSIVTLLGSGSMDPDGDPLTYNWVQTLGPTVQLEQSPNGDLKFRAPEFQSVIEFTLTVSDGELISNKDTVQVSIGAATLVPFADAGFDQFVPRNSTVQLFGWAYDFLGRDLTFNWTQISGSVVTLLGADTAAVSFVAPNEAGVIVLELTASNGVATSAPDRIEIHVRNYPPAMALSLNPDPARTLDDISATVDIHDADGDELEVTYAWKRNGVVVAGLTGTTYPNNRQNKGDVIEFVVEAKDGFEASTSTATVTIQDTPATITANPPSELPYGSTLAFNLSATDVDGDSIGDFVVKYGPAGIKVTGSGAVSWPAVLPMFTTAQLVNYGIGLANQPDAVFAGAVTIKDANRRTMLRRTGIEIPARDGALKVVDLNADGKDEALIGAFEVLYQLTWNGTDYVQTWSYPFHLDRGNGMVVEAADVTGDSAMEIFVGAGERLIRMEGVSKKISGEFSLGSGEIFKKLKAADLDGDGKMEVVSLIGSANYFGAGRIVVIDPVTMTEKWRTIDFGDNASNAVGMTVGDVDADSALEIIVGSGYVFDGSTHQVQWAYGPGFGFVVDAGDVDGDGIDEIVGVQDWTAVRVFSATVKSPLWDIPVSDVDALLVRDIEGSSAAEILVGDGQWGNVTAYKYSAGNVSKVFQINSQGHGVTAIDFGDLDGDGMKEFIWGTDASSSGPDSVVVAGRNPSIVVEWINDQPKQLSGIFTGGQLAAIGPGQSRLIFGTGSTDNGYEGARLLALDPTSGELKISASEIGTNWAHMLNIDPVDYDADGLDEIFIGTADLYDGYMSAYDFAGDTEEWRSPADVGISQAITHAELNDDGFEDLVAITQASSGQPSRIHVFDVQHSSLIWRSTALTGAPVDVSTANLSGDSTPEIIVLTGDRITIYTKATVPATFIESASYPVSGGTDLLVGDTDGDSEPELYVLVGGYSSDAQVLRFDAGLDLASSFAVGVPASSLHLEDLPTEHRNIILGTGDGYYLSATPPELRAVDPMSGVTVWRSPAFTENVPRNSLFYVDPDADGKPQISFASGSSACLTY